MSQLYLFATLASTRIAVRSQEVEAVVKLADISPVPGMGAHIAGLSALRSRVLTIVDAAALIDGQATPADRRSLAIICNVAGHSYGMMVDAISDICPVAEGELPLRGRIGAAWAPYADGIVDYQGEPHLLVTLARFIEGAAVPHAA
ncbi:MAG: chemotaxis protein CheW [Sphingobium sp.]